MTQIYTEIHNVVMFFEMILSVLVFTGLGAGTLIVLGYELATKRRA